MSKRIPEDTSILHRRLVCAETMRGPAGQIIRWLIQTYMAEEGWEAGTIDDGPVIELPFHFVSLYQSFYTIEQVSGGSIWLEWPNLVYFHAKEQADEGSVS